jgi:hypothetical protein
MPSTPNASFPFDKNIFHIDFFESGNSPDYSFVYAPGAQAGRGSTEGYDLKNCPKGDPFVTIQTTGNTSSDIMRYNYVGIDFSSVGDGKKWYFVLGKTMLNYPTPISEGGLDQYAIEWKLQLDVWETYKDRIGSPVIHLSQVTIDTPGSWNDPTML